MLIGRGEYALDLPGVEAPGHFALVVNLKVALVNALLVSGNTAANLTPSYPPQWARASGFGSSNARPKAHSCMGLTDSTWATTFVSYSSTPMLKTNSQILPAFDHSRH